MFNFNFILNFIRSVLKGWFVGRIVDIQRGFVWVQCMGQNYRLFAAACKHVKCGSAPYFSGQNYNYRPRIGHFVVFVKGEGMWLWADGLEFQTVGQEHIKRDRQYRLTVYSQYRGGDGKFAGAENHREPIIGTLPEIRQKLGLAEKQDPTEVKKDLGNLKIADRFQWERFENGNWVSCEDPRPMGAVPVVEKPATPKSVSPDMEETTIVPRSKYEKKLRARRRATAGVTND